MGVPASEVADVALKAFASIWAQETAHTRLLDSLRRVGGERGTQLTERAGALEGIVTSLATAPGLAGMLARLGAGFGRALGQAPAFTAGLEALTFREFCRFSAELEATAAEGYARLADLQTIVEGSEEDTLDGLKHGLVLRYEVAKTLAEERFHAAILETIPSWLADDSCFLVRPGARQRVAELRALADRHLALSLLPARLVSEVDSSTRGIGDPWVSDAGCGDLFREYGFVPEIVTRKGPTLAEMEAGAE